ncbi:uncharacterized protein G2W53_033665 [Senna tora]|uniref:Uncharacterized protein n=1 Tax=Senna tora TaxID=362788 RepID=A0A834WD12_9FABA|nr:uncharacterized protein G2W53_033665 [Senna tora]
MEGAWIMSQHIPDDKSRSDLRNLHELRGKRLDAQVSQTRRFALYSRTGVVLMLRLESSWHGRSVDHVLTYSGRQIAVGSQKPSRITRKKTCCASESNTSGRVVFAYRSGFDAPIGVVFAWEERGSCLDIFGTTNRAWITSQHILDDKSMSDLRNLHELRGKRLVAQVSQTRRFALYSRTGVVLTLRLESSWHGRSVDHVSTYSGRQLAVGSQKPSRITRQKTCCASESNTSVRVVFADRSGFDAPIGVVLAWEERGSCLNVFRTTNRGRISETLTNYKAIDLLRNVSNTSVRILFVNQSGFDAPIGVVLAWEERGSCLNILWTTNRGRISEPSRITRQKTCCERKSNTSVRVVFANRSGFDAQIGVVFAWEERGSCLNIFRTKNRNRISETFTNYEAKDLLRNLGMGGAWITFEHIMDDKSRLDLRNLHELRGKRLVAQVSQARRFALYSRTGVVLMLQWESFGMGGAWIMSQHIPDDKSRSDLKNHHELRGKRLVAQVSQTRRFALYSRTGVVLTLQLESSWHGRSVDHVSTYFGRQITVRSQKPSRITRQKTCCASESNTSVRVVLANRSGFSAPIGVVWHGRSVDHVLTYSGRQTAVGSQKPSRITRQKACCRSESNKSVRVVLANRCGFDAPIGVVLAWEERGSCLNIFWTKNRCPITETFTNYEAKDLLRK